MKKVLCLMNKVQYNKKDKILETMKIKIHQQHLPIHNEISKLCMVKNSIKINWNLKQRFK